MSLIKKKDVKMHNFERQRKARNLVKSIHGSPATEPSVTDLSIEANAQVFVDDFSSEHSSSGGVVSAVVMVTDCDDSQVPDLLGTPRS